MEGTNWIDMAQLVGSCECDNEPSGSAKWRISRLAEDLLASQEALCSMQMWNQEAISTGNIVMCILLNVQGLPLHQLEM